MTNESSSSRSMTDMPIWFKTFLIVLRASLLFFCAQIAKMCNLRDSK